MSITNISGLANNQTAALALSGLILVTPNTNNGYQAQSGPITGQGSNPSLQEALLFNYEGEQTILLESDITDHYIEDNTAVQDQIALHPVVVTTHGFIGELNDVVPPFLAPLKTVTDKLTVISSFTPSLSITAINAYNQAFQTYQVAQGVKRNAISAWSSINGGAGNQTQQQFYFTKFQAYWANRTLFTIQTPWAIYQNMSIKTLRAIQDAETRTVTDFELTFKQMRFSTTILFSPVRQTRLSSQASTETNNGTFAAAPAPVSFSSQISSSVGGQ